MLICFGRVISDFWSACLFANHLCVSYARLESGIPAANIRIVEPKVSYQHLAVAERTHFMRNPEIPFRLMQFWEGKCAEYDKSGERQIARIARIPTQPSDTPPEFKYIPLKIVQKYVRSFRHNFIMPRGVSIDDTELPQLLSLTAFNMLLVNVLKATDFLIGFNVSIRESFPTSTFGLFGPLNNNAILRLVSTNAVTFTDMLLAVNDEVLSARRHAHFPFARSAARLGLDRLPIQVCCA